MYGVIDSKTYLVCDIERSSQLSDRLYARQMPEFANASPMVFDPRPISTKYDLMPIMDRRATAQIPIKADKYRMDNLGNKTTPSYGWYAERVNQETDLRNTKRKTKASGDEQYVPSSASDMFNYNVKVNQTQQYEKGLQNHSLLFHEPQNLVTSAPCKMPDTSRAFDNPTQPKQAYAYKPVVTRAAQQAVNA